MSPLSASPAVGGVGGRGAGLAGLLSAGSGPRGSCETAHLGGTAKPETGCSAGPGGPAGITAGTIFTFRC